MTATLTVSIWHNVTHDPTGRHAGFGGFTHRRPDGERFISLGDPGAGPSRSG